MSLRVKVELILFITFALVVGLGYAIQRFVIIPQLVPVERDAAESDMERCIGVLDRQRIALRNACAELADDPALRGDAAEDAARVLATAARKSDLSAAVLLDAAFNPVAAHYGPTSATPAYDAEAWAARRDLLQATALGQGAGADLTTAGPVLVAVSALSGAGASTAGASTAGYLVLYRLLSPDRIQEMQRHAATSFQLWPVTDPAFSPEERSIVQEFLAGKKLHIEESGPDLFRVYAAYPGLTGQPVLLLRSDLQRNLLARARATMQTGLLANVGIGLAALVLLIILFRRTVMDALSLLTRHTAHIGKTGDLSLRLVMDRQDELGTLSHEFNRMVEQLEADREYQLEVKEQLRESEERYARAVRGANDGLWDWNLGTDEIHFSERWKNMLGFEGGEIGPSPDEWLDRIHPEDRENVLAALEAHRLQKTAHFESEHRIRHKSGTYLWVLCRGLAVWNPDGEPAQMAGSQTDITLRKIFEEQLRHQALHDSLTSLPNRALFLDRLNQAIKMGTRHADYQFAVLFLDLDRFKVINDGLGHVIGDALLGLFAEKLRGILRAVDSVCRHSGTLARFGGDEFVVLLDNISSVADATLVARRVERALEEPFRIDSHEVYTTCSIGIAMSNPGYTSAEELIRNADTAMYRAKAQGKACFEIFDSDMHSKAMERLQLENDMRRAIDRGEFIVHYQPIISLESGRITAFEALIRWRNPERGLVSPAEFIPIAEETGMIVALGEFVLRTACAQARAWHEELPRYADLKISVNLSVKEFGKPDLIGSITDILTETRLDPRLLKLEITESALMDSVEFVTRTLRQLRDMGIELLIDDFGTGYSSLSYLHRFPTHTLKIDQSFIRDMQGSHESAQIVRTVVLLARALSMGTIAEGIEEESQARRLRDLECGAGQGYFFSRPLPVEEATALLKSDPVWFAPPPDNG